MSLTISPHGIALIKKFEGFSGTAYRCPAGKWTVGYGHVLASPCAGVISEKEAELLLMEDLKPVTAAINRLVTVPLSQNQFDALCSLVYNIGVGAFGRSNLLARLNARDPLASWQFSRWVFAGKIRLQGLKNRRDAERELFEKQG